MLLIFTPGGFEDVLRATGRPAETRTLTPRCSGCRTAIRAHGCKISGDVRGPRRLQSMQEPARNAAAPARAPRDVRGPPPDPRGDDGRSSRLPPCTRLNLSSSGAGVGGKAGPGAADLRSKPPPDPPVRARRYGRPPNHQTRGTPDARCTTRCTRRPAVTRRRVRDAPRPVESGCLCRGPRRPRTLDGRRADATDAVAPVLTASDRRRASKKERDRLVLLALVTTASATRCSPAVRAESRSALRSESCPLLILEFPPSGA
jgi:hypothetical protein